MVRTAPLLPFVADVGHAFTVVEELLVARTKSQRADEDALDPVEAADVEHADDPDAGLLELDPEADPDDEEDDEDDEDDEPDDLDAGEPDPDDADDTDDDDPSALDGADVDDPEDGPVVVAALPDAAFDDDEAAAVVVDADDDDDDGDEIEGVRDGEFVCRRCYMAMRETQLADADRLLCRDCA